MSASAAKSRLNPVDVPVTRLLSQVGAEVVALAEFGERLQTIVGPLVMQAASHDPQHLRDLQGLDALCQKLRGIGDFLAVLAPATPEHWYLDPTEASRAVLLSDLALRLGANDGTLDPNEADASGDFEMF